MGKVIDEASLLKSVDGLNEQEKVKKLITKILELDALNTKLREKTVTFDRVTKLNEQYEKKLERANQILVRTEESKSKLEELCRGLQRLNHQIKEETASKIKKLELERQDAVEQLRTTVKDIERSMVEGREKSDQLVGDNRRLAEKLHEIGKEYELRVTAVEEQYEKKENYWKEYTKTKEIEIKLLNAKLEASNINQQKLDLEKSELTKTLIEETARVGGALDTEALLREQVKQYAEKYSELSKSLSSSNTAFDKFKKEIDRVNANCKKVETDVGKWKTKYDESVKNVLVLTMAKKELEDQAVVRDKKIEKLEGLCRALTQRKEKTSTAEEAIVPAAVASE